MTRTALYRHYDAHDDLIYVGITSNPSRRDAEHSAGSDWFGEVSDTEVTWYEDRKSAQIAEANYILNAKPTYNKTYCDKGDVPFAETARILTMYRLSLGLDQAEFAASIGCNRSQLSNWEGGKCRLSLDGALAIRAAHGRSLDFFFPREAPNDPPCHLHLPSPLGSGLLRGGYHALSLGVVMTRADAEYLPLLKQGLHASEAAKRLGKRTDAALAWARKRGHKWAPERGEYMSMEECRAIAAKAMGTPREPSDATRIQRFWSGQLW